MGKGKNKNTSTNYLNVDKVEEADLARLQNIVNHANKLQFDLGSITAQQHALAHRFAAAQDQIKALQAEVGQKYGTINIDIQTGEIDRGDVEE